MKMVIFSEKVDFSCFGVGHRATHPPSWLRERRRRVAHFPRGGNIRGPERGDRRPRAGGPEAPSRGAEAPSYEDVCYHLASTPSSQTLLETGDTLTGCPRNVECFSTEYPVPKGNVAYFSTEYPVPKGNVEHL